MSSLPPYMECPTVKLDIYQVDAFSQHPFGGNPAAVCPLTEWLSDEQLQDIAAENNLSETAYFVPRGDFYELRWFTPTVDGLKALVSVGSACTVSVAFTPVVSTRCVAERLPACVVL